MFVAREEARSEEGDETILLGGNSGAMKVDLPPTSFQCVGH
jgi:hypothetical protein